MRGKEPRVDHRGGARTQFLGRLGQQDQRAAPAALVVCHGLGESQQSGGMRIVSARVADRRR